MKKVFRIIRPVGLKPKPDQYEERIAEICADLFQSDIEFVVRGSASSPDIKVLKLGQYWEIKNIRSVGKHAVEDNLRKASKQARNVIISLLKTQSSDSRRVESRIRSILATKRMPIERVILITKTGKAIDIR